MRLLKPDPNEKRSAIFSPCNLYRYILDIRWADGPFIQVIGLNPSTADEKFDDPTVRKCKEFAKKWGYSGLIMTNIFAFRATDPRVMKAHEAPIGVLNDWYLNDINQKAALCVAAWGNHGDHLERSFEIKSMFTGLKCFRITKMGEPEHPLYQPYTAKLIDFN